MAERSRTFDVLETEHEVKRERGLALMAQWEAEDAAAEDDTVIDLRDPKPVPAPRFRTVATS